MIFFSRWHKICQCPLFPKNSYISPCFGRKTSFYILLTTSSLFSFNLCAFYLLYVLFSSPCFDHIVQYTYWTPLRITHRLQTTYLVPISIYSKKVYKYTHILYTQAYSTNLKFIIQQSLTDSYIAINLLSWSLSVCLFLSLSCPADGTWHWHMQQVSALLVLPCDHNNRLNSRGTEVSSDSLALMVGDLQKYANLLLMELAFVGKIGDQSSVILLCCNSNQRLEAFFLG